MRARNAIECEGDDDETGYIIVFRGTPPFLLCNLRMCMRSRFIISLDFRLEQLALRENFEEKKHVLPPTKISS